MATPGPTHFPDLEIERTFAAEFGVVWVAGVDEAGRGALAGPVVAAAVMLPIDDACRPDFLAEVRFEGDKVALLIAESAEVAEAADDHGFSGGHVVDDLARALGPVDVGVAIVIDGDVGSHKPADGLRVGDEPVPLDSPANPAPLGGLPERGQAGATCDHTQN